MAGGEVSRHSGLPSQSSGTPRPAGKKGLLTGTCAAVSAMQHSAMHFLRNRAWFLLLLVLQPAGLSAQEKSDAATIRSLEMKWAESYMQRSIDILSSLLADDFTITVEDGNVTARPDTSVTQRIPRCTCESPNYPI